MTRPPERRFSFRSALPFTCGVAGLALFAHGAAAQSSQTCTVTRIHVRATDGLVYFFVDGPRTTAPACATQAYWVIGNEASTAGRQQLALLMMAEAAGKAVIVSGSGTCARRPDAENVVEIAVSD